jgi:Flp pilus assembly protein TadB
MPTPLNPPLSSPLVREAEPVANEERPPARRRRLVRYYPAFIALGVVLFVISGWALDGWAKITSALWVALVLQWSLEYRAYRRSLKQ